MSEFKGDESKVLDLIEERLRIGEQRYGALNVHDKRDKVQEALEEALDLAVYLATQLVALKEDSGR